MATSTKYQLIEVKWFDAQLHMDAVEPADFESTFKPAIRRTTGRLVLDAHTHIAIASTIDADGCADGVWIIPKTWLASVYILSDRMIGVGE